VNLSWLKDFHLGICGLVLLCAGSVSASVEVSHAWLRAPIPGQNMTAAYFQLYNTGTKIRKLQAVEANFSERAEMHTQRYMDGVLQMRPLPFVEVAPQQRINFESGGHHIMLFDLDMAVVAHGVAASSTKKALTLVLIFADGQRLPVVLSLRSLHDVTPRQSIHNHH